jgi:RNA polymerase sigma-70 factor, ECF subfamily
VTSDDRDLIERFKSGDPSGFVDLVHRYQDRIYNLCRYMIGDAQDAQDAAQDVFLKVHGNLKSYKPDSSLYTWLYRITVNTCLDHQKKKRPKPFEDESAIDNIASAHPSPERLYRSKETGRLIEEALQRLPKAFRAAIVLKEIEGLSYEEISIVLHASLGTIKSRISRAREELRRLLEKDL